MKTLSAYLAALTLGSALSVSAPAAAGGPAPSPAPTVSSAPDDIVLRAWPNRRLLFPGSTTVTSSGAASAMAAQASHRKATSKLFLPVARPWRDLEVLDCESDGCSKEHVKKLPAEGALPAIGALTLLLGLTTPESAEKSWYLIGNERLSLRPQLGMAVRGLTATGKF